MTTTPPQPPSTPLVAPSAGRPERPSPGEPVRASGGPRYAVAIGVDALGSGMLRPFLLLYGVRVLGLGVAQAGAAMSIGMLLGLTMMPFLGRWIDRGARSAAVAGAMAIRVLGVAALLVFGGLAAPACGGFAVAALFLGIGDQCRPPAHAALVGTVADERYRDAAPAAGRSLRNAGMGTGALIATLATAGGTGAMRVLAAVTGLGYAVAALPARSLRVTGTGRPGTRDRVEPAGERRAGGRIGVLDVANLPYAFCFNVLEVALPAVLVTRMHASPAWSAGIFVANTLIVVTSRIAVVV
ncbi:MFS transporter [Embleya sp. NPDC020886]|uniref:MFS transporter n=1 Tax=Embleya sp. NPDC020886 TaxID=3363980 RepID=UPI0037A05DDE